MKKVLVFFFIMILANVCIEAQKSPLHYYTIKASQYNSGDLSGLTLNNSDVTKKWTLYSSQYLVTSLKLNGSVFNFNGISSLYDELPGLYYPTPYSSTDSIIAYNGWYDGDYYKGANLLQFVDFHQLGSDYYSYLMVQYKSGNIWKDGYYLKGGSLSKNSFTLSDTALAKSRPDCFDKSTTFRIVKYPQSGKGDYWPMVSNELSFLFYGQPEMDLTGNNVVCEGDQIELKGYYAQDAAKEYCRINARLMVATSNP
ncbi:MAG: hypothetical protein Q8904_15000, partial [Bacteroidota bacterium]|nr:hypothetical protein [Bacteroidota bacterium]